MEWAQHLSTPTRSQSHCAASAYESACCCCCCRRRCLHRGSGPLCRPSLWPSSGRCHESGGTCRTRTCNYFGGPGLLCCSTAGKCRRDERSPSRLRLLLPRDERPRASLRPLPLPPDARALGLLLLRPPADATTVRVEGRFAAARSSAACAFCWGSERLATVGALVSALTVALPGWPSSLRRARSTASRNDTGALVCSS